MDKFNQTESAIIKLRTHALTISDSHYFRRIRFSIPFGSHNICCCAALSLQSLPSYFDIELIGFFLSCCPSGIVGSDRKQV